MLVLVLPINTQIQSSSKLPLGVTAKQFCAGHPFSDRSRDGCQLRSFPFGRELKRRKQDRGGVSGSRRVSFTTAHPRNDWF